MSNGLHLVCAAFSALADHLRERVPTRSVTVTSVTYDPTYGDRSTSEDIEIVDMDMLTDEIEAFANRLRSGEVTL